MKNIQQCGELNSNVGENRTEKAINENKIVYIQETKRVERWVKLGRLTEQHPDMLFGDLMEHLTPEKHFFNRADDTPLAQGKDANYEKESVRMMMIMLIYALNRHCPNHPYVGQAMDLMTQLGMHKVTDTLR